jgi:hypothetical protein
MLASAQMQPLATRILPLNLATHTTGHEAGHEVDRVSP